MKKYALLFLLLIYSVCFSQAGNIDATFNTTDLGNGLGDGPNSTVSKSLKLAGGKILLIGNFTAYNDSNATRIVKINTNGSIDPTFATGTGANAYVYSAAEQSDGKIIIGGNFTSYNGTTVNRIIRINTDGTLDTTFSGVGTGPSSNSIVDNILILPGGKILITGTFSTYNGINAVRMARLNTDGSLDATFTCYPGVGNASASIGKMEYDATNQKIYVGGSFTSINGTTVTRIARLNSDGTVDTTFNTGTGTSQGFNNTVSEIVLLNSGKILVGGTFGAYNGTSTLKNICRLNSDGTLDTTFNHTNAANNSVYSIKVIGNNLFVGGNFATYSGTTVNRLVKLDLDGTLDTTYNAGNSGANSSVTTILDNLDGTIFIIGSFNIYNDTNKNYCAHILADGSLDNTYNVGTGADGNVSSILFQPDNKIIISGDFTSYNGTIQRKITRLNTDGTLDTSFNSGGSGMNGTVAAVALQSNGKIVAGGTFTKYNGNTVTNLVRINSDGSYDNSALTLGTAFNNSITAVAVQSDGKIIVGGSFTSYNGTTINRLARLNTDGTLDATFAIGTGANTGSISAILIQNDGKIIVTGLFTTFNGTTARIVRLNTGGDIDTSFNPGTGPNLPLYTAILQQDGKILVGGNFSTFNGVSQARVARLNANGNLDTTFIPGTSIDASVQTLAVQPDNKVIIGGLFTKYGTTLSNKIMRLNADGTLDTSFDVGGGANNTINKLVLDQNNNVLIGGLFTNYKNGGKNRIARILNVTTSLATTQVKNNTKDVSVYPNPFTTDIHIDTQEKLSNVSVFDMSGKLVHTSNQKDLNLSHLLKGTYLIKATTVGNKVIIVRKIIKK
ncbi:T9SS type A sorting domain-containing protein [Chryseobacterium gwangjuense]|uniref:T9SS type A sorting domain-containing protein n=1 Tax=Chryseobacterium gwangjuense TaxID=1069980 RepID=UPI001E5AA319|nr:T9SS type A sorting domain-containing protein [Chryseobacterium gwangjuense]MCE3076331.1 T9SS type A sorting domain-containing protein [Chryseobacterium gwangjuense]